jgi:hypothetical protein
MASVQFYQKCRVYIDEIKGYDSKDCLALHHFIKSALAEMLLGVLRANGKIVARGTLKIAPTLELMFRRTLASLAFSKLGKADAVQKLMRLKKIENRFLDSLKPWEVAKKFSSWNQTYPQEHVVTQRMLDDWNLFKEVRNRGGHALSADLTFVRENAPHGFQLISKLLEIREGLPNEYKYPLE